MLFFHGAEVMTRVRVRVSVRFKQIGEGFPRLGLNATVLQFSV